MKIIEIPLKKNRDNTYKKSNYEDYAKLILQLLFIEQSNPSIDYPKLIEQTLIFIKLSENYTYTKKLIKDKGFAELKNALQVSSNQQVGNIMTKLLDVKILIIGENDIYQIHPSVQRLLFDFNKSDRFEFKIILEKEI